MDLPFTTEQFLAVFARYNEAVWPAQALLTALGLSLAAAAFFPGRVSPRMIPLGLAVLWAWMGVVYHLIFFRQVNPLAPAFAAAFVLQAALLGWWGRRAASFRPAHRPRAWLGAALLLYALVLYPRLATVFGHVYPARPTFGLPCPTTIATLGLLLWADPIPPWWLWLIPLGWSAVGGSAAFRLGMGEDLGLVAAGLAVLAAQAVAWRGRATPAP